MRLLRVSKSPLHSAVFVLDKNHQGKHHRRSLGKNDIGRFAICWSLGIRFLLVNTMWRQLRVKNVFAKNTWNPNIYCGWNLKLTSSSIQSASVVYLLKQNYKCPVWRHLNSCISTQLLLGWQPKICFKYRGFDPHAVCHQTNCTLATLTHPRFLNNRRLENLVLCLNIPQKSSLDWMTTSFSCKKSQQNWWILCCVFFAKNGPFLNASG